MTMYWIYDIPNWLLGALTTAVFVAVSVLGLLATRPFVRKLLGESGKHNDVTSYYIAAVGVLYGLALGLIAVATYQNYTDVDGKASREANALAGLYRDLDGYPEPLRGQLEDRVRDYTRFVIEKDWPAHRRGEVVDGADAMVEGFENQMMDFEPAKEREKIVHAEVIDSLDGVVEARAARLQAVGTALPAVLWGVMLFGAALNVGLTYLFWVENLRLHILLVAAFSASIALLVFLTAAMDNPFRGEFSVSADAYRSVLDTVLKPVARGK